MKIDAFERDLAGETFEVTLPPPFGPGGSTEAIIRVKAKPAGAPNTKFVNAMEKAVHQAGVRDRVREAKFKKDEDEEARSNQMLEDIKFAQKQFDEILFDHCVIEWSSTIQSDGQDLEPTREAFLEIFSHRHPAIRTAVDQLRKKITDHASFFSGAWREQSEDETKN